MGGRWALWGAVAAVLGAGLAWAEGEPAPAPPEATRAAALPDPAPVAQPAAVQPGAAPGPDHAAVPTEPPPAPAVAAPAAPPPAPPRDPNRGAVTNLPLPRYVSLKTDEGNARRGPGLTHRIDWVFTRTGMPLRITAEYENWRRVEDPEGVGGWIHYSLLSGVRSVLVMQDMVEFRARPDPQATVVAQAELGVVARLLECTGAWCRISAEGNRGWVPQEAVWGVDPGEVIE